MVAASPQIATRGRSSSLCGRWCAVPDPWLEHVAAKLGVSPDVPVDALLDSARVVAHSVERKMTPLTAYLIGLAAGNDADPEQLCRRIAELARAWENDQG